MISNNEVTKVLSPEDTPSLSLKEYDHINLNEFYLEGVAFVREQALAKLELQEVPDSFKDILRVLHAPSIIQETRQALAA